MALKPILLMAPNETRVPLGLRLQCSWCFLWNFPPPSICPTARLWCHDWALSLAGLCAPAALERYNWTAGFKGNVKLVVTHLWPLCYYIISSPEMISIDLKFHEIRPEKPKICACTRKMEKIFLWLCFFHILYVSDNFNWEQKVKHGDKLNTCNVFHRIKCLFTSWVQVDNPRQTF